jgi:hypothetical protein
MGSVGLSDRIRSVAQEKYVVPAIRAGQIHFVIRVRDLLNDLQTGGFPGHHTPQICSALKTAKFLRENGLEIESIEGPPSKQSPTVVVRYRVTQRNRETPPLESSLDKEIVPAEETPEARALRLTTRLRGLLKDELAEYGGGEAFLRWVRGHEEEDAA